ncbi:hypothetical protein RJ641_022358 [Dillenia turbinata]|uniref:Uncharacterized protein n=1 Tax=Dillenia turbinata TaxID=194707 RepID=A0AAN8ULT3_9MAGN
MKQGDENVGVALLTYPVLMASNILLYQVREPLIPPAGAQMMSLTAGLSKVRYEEIMSDSAYLDKVLSEGAEKAADIADAAQ